MKKDKDLKFELVIPKINLLFDDTEHKVLSPLSCLREFSNHWKLEFDLPLVNKKDIKITFNENTISVEAKLKEKYAEEKLGKITKFEYFKKSILLPGKIDVKKTVTRFHKGRMEIKIPKETIGQNIKID